MESDNLKPSSKPINADANSLGNAPARDVCDVRLGAENSRGEGRMGRAWFVAVCMRGWGGTMHGEELLQVWREALKHTSV